MIYPSSLCPGKFYETAKIHKSVPSDSLLCLYIYLYSNYETATHHV